MGGEAEEGKEMTSKEPKPADFLGQAILLHLAIKELTKELTVEICQNCPRLVLMVLSDLERRSEEIVESMKAKMQQKQN